MDADIIPFPGAYEPELSRTESGLVVPADAIAPPKMRLATFLRVNLVDEFGAKSGVVFSVINPFYETKPHWLLKGLNDVLRPMRWNAAVDITYRPAAA